MIILVITMIIMLCCLPANWPQTRLKPGGTVNYDDDGGNDDDDEDDDNNDDDDDYDNVYLKKN